MSGKNSRIKKFERQKQKRLELDRAMQERKHGQVAVAKSKPAGLSGKGNGSVTTLVQVQTSVQNQMTHAEHAPPAIQVAEDKQELLPSRDADWNLPIIDSSSPALAEKLLGQVALLDPNMADYDPTQPRRDIDREKIKGLAEALKQDGQEEEVHFYLWSVSGRWVVHNGQRRYEAAKLAHRYLRGIVIQEPLNSREKRRSQISSNENRENLLPIDQGRAIYEGLYDDSPPMTMKELARLFNQSESWVQGRLRLFRELAPELKRYMSTEFPEKQRLPVSKALEFTRLSKEMQVEHFLALKDQPLMRIRQRIDELLGRGEKEDEEVYFSDTSPSHNGLNKPNKTRKRVPHDDRKNLRRFLKHVADEADAWATVPEETWKWLFSTVGSEDRILIQTAMERGRNNMTRLLQRFTGNSKS